MVYSMLWLCLCYVLVSLSWCLSVYGLKLLCLAIYKKVA